MKSNKTDKTSWFDTAFNKVEVPKSGTFTSFLIEENLETQGLKLHAKRVGLSFSAIEEIIEFAKHPHPPLSGTPSRDQLKRSLEGAGSQSETEGVRVENDLKKIEQPNAQLCRIVKNNEGTFYSLSSWSSRFDCIKGISCKTIEYARENPEIKQWPSTNLKKKYNLECDELLLVLNGVILEGEWSNFFWVNAKEQLCTAQDKILKGITRELLIERCKQVNLRALKTSEIKDIRAAFITHATHGIVPIREIDSVSLEIVSLEKFFD